MKRQQLWQHVSYALITKEVIQQILVNATRLNVILIKFLQSYQLNVLNVKNSRDLITKIKTVFQINVNQTRF